MCDRIVTIPAEKIHVVTNEDGSESFHIGDTVFGPYGPGQCDSVHPGSGTPCKHRANHVGCHASEDGDDKTPTYRWW